MLRWCADEKNSLYFNRSHLISLCLLFLFRSIFKVLDLEWTSLFQDLEKTEKVLFLALMFSLALAFLLVLFWTMVDEISRRRIQANLKRLLTGKDIKSLGDADLDASFRNLSGKLGLLTEAIQKADNQALIKEAVIIEKERKRIARDLHDTVSQEIFCCPYDFYQGSVNKLPD